MAFMKNNVNVICKKNVQTTSFWSVKKLTFTKKNPPPPTVILGHSIRKKNTKKGNVALTQACLLTYLLQNIIIFHQRSKLSCVFRKEYNTLFYMMITYYMYTIPQAMTVTVSSTHLLSMANSVLIGSERLLPLRIRRH